jgi:3-methyladenine DNA glycosylase/8-oxoguanine DNA glycosylase
MTLLFAMRLVSLGVALHSKGIASCVEVILSNDPEEIRNLLLPVNGIGPKVIGNFLLLRGIKD